MPIIISNLCKFSLNTYKVQNLEAVFGAADRGRAQWKRRGCSSV